MNIYDLKLNESTIVEEGHLFTTVIRVPGGWFYRSFDKMNNILTGVFVPFSMEFILPPVIVPFHSELQVEK